jgi:hypothetical protein
VIDSLLVLFINLWYKIPFSSNKSWEEKFDKSVFLSEYSSSATDFPLINIDKLKNLRL